MYYYTRKEFDNYTKILRNSVDMKFTLLKESIFLTTKKINSLAETLLYNKDVLDEMTIDEIVKDSGLIDRSSGKRLRVKISEDLGQKNIKEISYRAIMFAFKYAAVKNFFYGQYRKFLPEYDYDQINASAKTRTFFEATMKELDRLDDAISSMSSAVDIDEIPYKYMEYLASLIGYESEDKNLVKDYVFRDLIKNMIEVYRVKGTNYSFELFLSFLGFNVNIKEYWFDRRFYYKKPESINEFTKATAKEKNSFIFYLSPLSPEEYIPSDLYESYAVFKNEIKGTMDLNLFNKYLRDGKYTIEQLLGVEEGFNDPYTYFKTNIVDFDFTSFKKENEQEVSEDDIKIINRVFEFLLPIFIKKQYMITINDWEENVNPDPELNDGWMYSFFLFNDKHHIDKTINIDYEEVKGFDPVYDRVRRWNQFGIYNKNAIVIYDNSIDYSFYKNVSFGNIICYNSNYYIYIGEGNYMLDPPSSDQDNYVSLPEYIFEWSSGMNIHNKEVIKYNNSYYIYLGTDKQSTKSPDIDSGFNLINNIICSERENNLLYPVYPSYYESNEFISDYNKYDYVLVNIDDESGLYDYAWSKVNHNIYSFWNNEKWESFNTNTIIDFPPIDNDLINGRVYRYLDNLYAYVGESKPPYTNPLVDEDFKLLNFRSDSTPGESDFWRSITFEENKDDFSVIDRLIFGEGLSEQQALEKISKILDAVCVTSNKIENFDVLPEEVQEWTEGITLRDGDFVKYKITENSTNYLFYKYKGETEEAEESFISPNKDHKHFKECNTLRDKYIYLDFYGNEHYEQGVEPIEAIEFDSGSVSVQPGAVIKYNNEYFYCYNSTTVTGIKIEQVNSTNTDPELAKIINNIAYSEYISTANAQDISVSTFPINVNFGDILKYNTSFLCCYNKTTINTLSEIQDVIDNNDSPYLALVENNHAWSNNSVFEYPILWKVYVPVNYKTIKVEFTGDNPTFNSVCEDIKTKLKEYHIIDNDNITGKYVFEQLDDSYFRIYSKPEEEFDASPYIKIQYDFKKDVDTTPCIEHGQDVSPLYGVDPNNAYYIFPDYLTSPRYRHDFKNLSYTHQAYEFANRRNYITEIYPSTKFRLKKILNRDVFEPSYDVLKFTDINYKLYDEFDKEKLYPKLANDFSFKDTEEKCYEEFYKDDDYKDLSVFAAEENYIYIRLSKSISPFYIGEKIIFNAISTDNYSYFLNGEITNIIQETKDGVNCIRLTSSTGLPQGVIFASGLLRKIDEKIYNIESIESGSIKVKHVFLDNNYIIPKPTVTAVVDTYEELMKYPGATDDVVEVLDDETYFGKTTCYKWENNRWNFVQYTKIMVYIKNSTETIQKECDVLTSTITDDYDIITINHPEILEGFISGKFVLCKNIWRLKDYFKIMNEYIVAGNVMYDYSGTNISTLGSKSYNCYPVSFINANEKKVYVLTKKISVSFVNQEEVFINIVSESKNSYTLKTNIENIDKIEIDENEYTEITVKDNLPNVTFASGTIEKNPDVLIFDGAARF